MIWDINILWYISFQCLVQINNALRLAQGVKKIDHISVEELLDKTKSLSWVTINWSSKPPRGWPVPSSKSTAKASKTLFCLWSGGKRGQQGPQIKDTCNLQPAYYNDDDFEFWRVRWLHTRGRWCSKMAKINLKLRITRIITCFDHKMVSVSIFNNN
jgi:hypothetical protein